MEFFAGIGAGWMNLASLALGLLAWMLPVAAMIRTAARPRALHPALPLVCVSFAACAAALSALRLWYQRKLSVGGCPENDEIRNGWLLWEGRR